MCYPIPLTGIVGLPCMTFTDKQIELARQILEAGGRRIALAKALGVSERQAMNLIALIEKGQPVGVRQQTRARIEELLALDANPYEMAVEAELSMTSTRTAIAKAKGKYCPAEDELRRFACTGARVVDLKGSFGFRSTQEAVSAMEAAFPGCYISYYAQDGHEVLTPIKETTPRPIPAPNRRFRVSISEDRTYCHIKLDDQLPGDEVRVVNFTDIHIGSRAHRADLFLRCVDMVKQDPMGFLFDGGDTTEFNYRESHGDPMEQYLTNTEQILTARDQFEPVIDKYLYKIWGNHEGGRPERACQLDGSELIAAMLHVPYFRHKVLVDLEWRGRVWKVYSSHKWGKSIDQAAVVKECRRARQDMGLPIHFFTGGHNHQSFIQPLQGMEQPTIGVAPRTYRPLVVNGGSFVRQTGTYANDFDLYPQDLTFLRLREDGGYKGGAIPINRI